MFDKIAELEALKKQALTKDLLKQRNDIERQLEKLGHGVSSGTGTPKRRGRPPGSGNKITRKRDPNKL